jgi:hypothetical protein
MKVKITKKVVEHVDTTQTLPESAPAPAPASGPVVAAASTESEPTTVPSKPKIKIVKKTPVTVSAVSETSTSQVAVKPTIKVTKKSIKINPEPSAQTSSTGNLEFSSFTHNGITYFKDGSNYLYEMDDTGALGNFMGRFNTETNKVEDCADPHA